VVPHLMSKTDKPDAGAFKSFRKMMSRKKDEVYAPKSKMPTELLYVIPMEARELAAADVNNRADPYAVVTYAGNQYKTKTCFNTLHPVWPWSVFAFDIVPGEKEFHIEIWDQDKLKKDDFLGEVTVNLADVPLGQLKDQWMDLVENKEYKSKIKVSGKVHFRIYHGLNLPALQAESMGKSFFLFDGQKELLKTGDCILFSGSEFVSGVIKKFLHTPYSHCGLVLRMKDTTKTPIPEEEEVFVAEADWDDGDYFNKDEKIYGIAINRFEDRMKDYSGDVIWHCPLKKPLNPEQCEKVRQFILASKQKKVKYDLFQGLKMMACFKNKESSNSVFCSELVAFALKEAGVLPETVNCSEQNPYDVAKLEVYDGQYPKTILRYQVEMDATKVSGAGLQEMKDLVFG